MSNFDECYASVIGQINPAAKNMDEDIAKIRERPWSMLRDHAEKVRHARFVCETGELEATRLHMLQTMAMVRNGELIAGLQQCPG